MITTYSNKKEGEIYSEKKGYLSGSGIFLDIIFDRVVDTKRSVYYISILKNNRVYYIYYNHAFIRCNHNKRTF